MPAERSRSIRVRRSSGLAVLIAREIALLATTNGRLVVFDVDDVDAVAERLAEVARSARPVDAFVDAQHLADELGVDRGWVYANAERLGAMRLGTGPRARLRFDVERAQEALTATSVRDDASGDKSRTTRRRGRPRRQAVPSGLALIQGRSSR